MPELSQMELDKNAVCIVKQVRNGQFLIIKNMKPSSQPSDDSRALQNALDTIASQPRSPEHEKFQKAATDMYDPGAVEELRGLVHGDFARLGQEEAQLTGGLTPEQQIEQWFRGFETHFDAIPALPQGIQREDVVKSLRADPESMKRLMALDAKGHNMTVFGYDEKPKEFIFASAWNKHEHVAADHRNIAYDPAGQKLAEDNGYHPNGNAISIIAKIMGCEEKDAGNYLASGKLHNQLRAAIENDIYGGAWLQTDAATRKTGDALFGNAYSARPNNADRHAGHGSFRASLRVKKV